MGKLTALRYEPLAGEYDVGICASAEGCRKGYPVNRHHKGYADPYGTIHWEGWVSPKVTRRGLHRLLSLIAVIKLKQHRRPGLPKWKALHEADIWAFHEGVTRYRIRFPITYSQTQRAKAQEDIKRHNVPTSMIDMAAYQWVHAIQYKENRRKNDDQHNP